VTEEADNGGFLSHSTGLSLDNSLSSFQEYTPWSTLVISQKHCSWIPYCLLLDADNKN